MASKRRANQVGDILWRELSRALMRSVSDPRLKTATITGVDVSSDLRHARVYVAMRDTENKTDMMAGLKKAAPFLRRLLSKETALRVVPVLHFYFDESIDRGMHLMRLLNDLPDTTTNEDSDGSSSSKDEMA